MIIVTCFISGHLRQKFIEIFSFFSERAVTCASCVMSFQFIPTVGIASYVKEPPEVTTETCPLIIL